MYTHLESVLKKLHGELASPFFVCLFCFLNRVLLHYSGCPGTYSLNQAGLKLRDPLASVHAGIKGVLEYTL